MFFEVKIQLNLLVFDSIILICSVIDVVYVV
jgi:hypothetical protein